MFAFAVCVTFMIAFVCLTVKRVFAGGRFWLSCFKIDLCRLAFVCYDLRWVLDWCCFAIEVVELIVALGYLLF